MNRLRHMRLRHWVFPVVLAALVARALVPPGFMSYFGDGQAPRIAMCSYDQQRSVPLELPGDAGHQGPRCEQCLAPLLGAPVALFNLAPVDAPVALRDTAFLPQLAQAAPAPRAQIPRAPPHA